MKDLPYDEWRDTLDTLHMWTQILGKIQLALAPPVNHWWHVAQHVNARGLTTRALPHGDRTYQIDLDLIRHVCRPTVSDGNTTQIPQREPEEVLTFLRSAYSAAADLGGWPRSKLERG